MIKENGDLRHGVYVPDKSGDIFVAVEEKEKIAMAVTP